MAVKLEASSIKRFRGLSIDEKPGRPVETASADGIAIDIESFGVGSEFIEDDTGHRYRWNGSWPWVRQEQTIEALFAELSTQMSEMTDILRVIQAATATQANGAFGAAIPTGR